jgi:cytochrome c-type biogenesis protein
MGQEINLLLAFIVGLASFLSPCIFPLFPSYLSFIGGTSLENLKTDRVSRTKAFVHTLFFVLGFSLVFIVVSIFLRTTLSLFSPVSQVINLIAGLVIIVLGLNFIFDFWKLLNVEKHINVKKESGTVIGALLFGMAFGAGWTPCVGPMLGAILLMAATEQNYLQSIFLLATFSLGLGLPFLLIGLFFGAAYKHYRKILPYLPVIKVISGLFLILIGVLVLTGRLALLTNSLAAWAYQLEGWQQAEPFLAKVIFSSFFLAGGIILSILAVRTIRKRKKETGKPDKWPWIKFSFIFIFLLVSVCIFTGLIDIPGLFVKWFTFEGL